MSTSTDLRPPRASRARSNAPTRARALVALLACALLASACGRFSRGGAPADDGTGSVGGAVGVQGKDPTTTAAPGGGTPMGQVTAAPPGTNSAGGPGTTARAPGSGGSGGPAGGQQAASGDDGRDGPVGAYARTILREGTMRRLVIELFDQEGHSPNKAAIDHLGNVLRVAIGNKQLTVTGPTRIPGGPQGRSAEEIRSLADQHGVQRQTASQAVVRVFYLAGELRGDTRGTILGAAVEGDVVAIFPENIEGAANVAVPPELIERAVVVHELGHILGLVDLAFDRDREDPSHPGHSRSQRSVMYWAIESNVVARVLGGPPPDEFDGDDHADLAAMREGR